jgi:orotidine-5'-phosphate decarboxylase
MILPPQHPELIVALDVPSSDSIPRLVDALPPQITWYKIGLEIFTSEGPAALAFLKKRGKSVFLDLKLHDIPRTVARAVASASRLGVNLLTVHAGGGREMLKAAADSAREAGPSAPAVVAVTTLTSLNDKDLKEMGISRPLTEHTLALGEMAISAGIHGLVCSPLEATFFRKKLGQAPILVTPGIRPAGADAGDQKRIATPDAAIKAGANFLVVGRPILEAPDMNKAALMILNQMQKA